MSCKLNFLLGSLLLSLFGFAQAGSTLGTKKDNAKKVFRYTNPITRDTAISMRDHFIVKAENKWYCVGTSNPVWEGPNPGVRLLVSDDFGRRKFIS
jgi:hypothetical protein